MRSRYQRKRRHLWRGSGGGAKNDENGCPMTTRDDAEDFDWVWQAEGEMAKARVGFEIGERGRGEAYEFWRVFSCARSR
jgi:hypothetical protein